MSVVTSTVQVTPAIPASNIALSQITAAFPGTGKALSQYYGVHPSVPTSGQLRFSHFSGINSKIPTCSNIDLLSQSVVSNTVTMTAGGYITGKASANVVASGSFNLASYLDVANYNGGSVTISLHSSSMPSGFSFSAQTLSISTNAPTSGNVAIVFKMTNAYGNYCLFQLNANITPATVQPKLLNIDLSTATGSYYFNPNWYQVTTANDLTSIGWTNYLCTTTTTTVAGPPQNFCWLECYGISRLFSDATSYNISGGVGVYMNAQGRLIIPLGVGPGSTYTVVVYAVNSAGQSSYALMIPIREDPAPAYIGPAGGDPYNSPYPLPIRLGNSPTYPGLNGNGNAGSFGCFVLNLQVDQTFSSANGISSYQVFCTSASTTFQCSIGKTLASGTQVRVPMAFIYSNPGAEYSLVVYAVNQYGRSYYGKIIYVSEKAGERHPSDGPQLNYGPCVTVPALRSGVRSFDMANFCRYNAFLMSRVVFATAYDGAVNADNQTFFVGSQVRNMTYDVALIALNSSGMPSMAYPDQWSFATITESSLLANPKFYFVPATIPNGDAYTQWTCGTGGAVASLLIVSGPGSTWNTSSGGNTGQLTTITIFDSLYWRPSPGQCTTFSLNYGTNGGGASFYYVKYTDFARFGIQMGLGGDCPMPLGVNDGSIEFVLPNGLSLTFANSMSLNTWYVVCFAFTATTQTLYLNGSAVESKNISSTMPNTSAAGCFLGGPYYQNLNFSVEIGGMMIFDYPMSENDVRDVTSYFQNMTTSNRNSRNIYMNGVSANFTPFQTVIA